MSKFNRGLKQIDSNHTGIFLGGFSLSGCTSIVLLLSVARALLDASVRFRVTLFLPQRLKPQRDLVLLLSTLVLSSIRVLLELRVSADSRLRVCLLSLHILSRRSSNTGTNSQYLRRELYQKELTPANIFKERGFLPERVP